MDMGCIEIGVLFIWTLLPFFASSSNIIPCGSFNQSSVTSAVRLLSHKGFNKRTKYGNLESCTWDLKLGKECEEQKVWCVYLKTKGKKKCKAGDFLTISGKKSKKKILKRYCGSKKPSSKKPLIFTSAVKMVWKTDKKQVSTGFDCRAECTQRKIVTTTPAPTTAAPTTTSSTTSTAATIANTKTVPPPTVAGPCIVVDGPGVGKPCQFPFIWMFTNQQYDGCIFDPSRDIAPWCSTKVVNGVHQSGQGQWGYCSKSCPLSSGVTTNAPTTPPPTVSPGIAYGCDCGKVNRRTRIINGQATEVNEYPWMAGIGSIGSLSPSCGGAVVSDQYILTAAHCCQGKSASKVQVFLGDHDWMDTNEADAFRRSVQTIKIHPQYQQQNTLNNDVCLLKLSQPISFPAHPNVRPVCLPPSSSNSYSNKKATVAGWGRTGGGAGISTYLQEIDVFVWPQDPCRRTFGSSITNSMMCISKNSNPIDATCNGDSGSSLIYKNGANYDTIGVVSWGIEGCQNGAPSVMARVTAFLSWIKQNIADSATCPRSYTPPPPTNPPTCVTVDGAVSGVPCIFPSIVAGVTLTGCSKIDGDTRSWCSTQVDSAGNQVQGQWGYCPDSGCPIHATRTMERMGSERSVQE